MQWRQDAGRQRPPLFLSVGTPHARKKAHIVICSFTGAQYRIIFMIVCTLIHKMRTNVWRVVIIFIAFFPEYYISQFKIVQNMQKKIRKIFSYSTEFQMFLTCSLLVFRGTRLLVGRCKWLGKMGRAPDVVVVSSAQA